jgi:hypothetical protein
MVCNPTVSLRPGTAHEKAVCRAHQTRNNNLIEIMFDLTHTNSAFMSPSISLLGKQQDMLWKALMTASTVFTVLFICLPLQ